VKYEKTSIGTVVPCCWRESTIENVRIRGFWVWWCKSHRQPVTWCEVQAYKTYAEDLEKRLLNLKNFTNGLLEGIKTRT
jgi:hypothetical protein